MMTKTGLRRVMVLGLVAAAVVSSAGAQNFQFFGGDGPGGMNAEPPVNSKQLARYADLLGLDADQREAASALLDGMQAEWDASSKKTRDEMDAIREEFQDARDPSIFMQRVPDLMRKQRESRTKLERTFMGDFKSLLTDEQQAGWVVVERVYRRDSTVPRGRLSGESVDLVRLAEELPLAASSKAAVKSMLDQYETDLDRALVERNEIVDQAQARIGDGPGALERALSGGDEEFQKLREKAREARLKVREINQRYARQIASALPGDEAAKFNEAFTRRSFPDVFRRSLTGDSLAAAAGFDDLTPEQKQSIASIQESFAQDVERANKALMEATEKFEATSEGYAAALGGGMRMRMFGDGGGESDKPNPVEEARSAKREIEKKALDKLKGLLNDEQRERLPKRRERGQGPRAMGGGPEGAVIIAGGEGEVEGGEDGQVVHVLRQVEVGPDGKPKEATAVFVQKLGPGEAPPEGEGDETIVEIHRKQGEGEGEPEEEEPKPE